MVKTISIQTEQKTEVINITSQLAEIIEGVSSGLALFYIPHTTAGLMISEEDPELNEDFIKVAENWLAGLKPFLHTKNNNPNTEAHVFSAFCGSRVSVAIEEGILDLGKYQNILFLEMDGPKRREVKCKLISV
jgi:secondary thiamine-phosphate synthase enzyme